MGRVRIVWGTATGSTELSSYDAALAAANVHDYNLVRVSSVLPAETSVDLVGTAPDLGPVGNGLTVVEARKTAPLVEFGETDAGRTTELVSAGLGWVQATNGRGIVYEASGAGSEEVRETIETGLRAGRALREFPAARSGRVVLSTDGANERIERDDGSGERTTRTRTRPTASDRSVAGKGAYEVGAVGETDSRGGDQAEHYHHQHNQYRHRHHHHRHRHHDQHQHHDHHHRRHQHNQHNQHNQYRHQHNHQHQYRHHRHNRHDRRDRSRDGRYVTAAVLAVYGESEPIL